MIGDGRGGVRDDSEFLALDFSQLTAPADRIDVEPGTISPPLMRNRRTFTPDPRWVRLKTEKTGEP